MQLTTLFSILRGDPVTVVTHAPYLLIGGFGLMALSYFGVDMGIITGFFAASLGCVGVCLTRWKSEHGLWMLAGLYLLINLYAYAMFLIGHIHDALRGVQIESLVLLLDATIGTWLLVATIRFLTRIAKENYVTSNSPSDHS